MNFCHQCQHARPTLRGFHCSVGCRVVWRGAKDALDLVYGYTASAGCKGKFAPGEPLFPEHRVRVVKPQNKAA